MALSLVYPEDDPRLEGELTRLRESLTGEVRLLAGGRAMGVLPSLGKLGVLPIESLDHLGATLGELRKPLKKAKR